jgi:hypothetical protein
VKSYAKAITMRLLLLSALFAPLAMSAQIDRSANELARENVQEYLVTKIFKDHSYKPGTYGKLKSRRVANNVEIAWSIEHWFEIEESVISSLASKSYKFIFFLDRRMEVLRADAAYIE